MKENGNDRRQGTYYIGLDVGTNSVGWAVTDENYQVKKFHGNAMWGVRLFEEAQPAADRRTSRVARRRLARRKQRLMLLEFLFAEEIHKVDPNFFRRLHESDRWEEDRATRCPYSIFHDAGFTDIDYHRNYPTVYHLRSELLQSTQPHDVRLVFLAIHHIMKTRGHFLYETGDNGDEILTVAQAFDQLNQYLQDEYDQMLEPVDQNAFLDLLQNNGMGITAKKKALHGAYGLVSDISILKFSALIDLIAGASVKPDVLFGDQTLKDLTSINLKNGLDELEQYREALGERFALLEFTKTLFDAARLSQIRKGYTYISQAKVAQYQENASDLRKLKQYVRAQIPDQYRMIFSEKKKGLDNYAAYSQYKLTQKDYRCDQEKFCKFLLGKQVGLPEPQESDREMCEIYRKIKDGAFLPKLRSSENGVIPYQLNRQELVQILKQASLYLPFLNHVDSDGLSVSDKIIKTFEFRVPYYVGPVSDQAGHHWAVRFQGKENEKIYPWNFEQVIDLERSAAGFMEDLVGRCTYTGEPVLPKDSLLYSEFMLLNEVNLIKINGKSLPVNVKKQLVQDLFYHSSKKVTKKGIVHYLTSKGLMTQSDELNGVDDRIKSTLRSYHDFKDILKRTGDRDMVENIIRSILVFGNDLTMLQRWLKNNTHDLTEEEIRRICNLRSKYKEWGRLSRTFLTEIYSPDEWGEAKSIMDYLRDTSCNLMQLLSNQYQFADQAKAHFDALMGNGQTLSQKLDDLYVAPAVRRSIRQTLRIVDEIVDIEHGVPKKIFIEMARDNAQEVKKSRTESRKDKLIALYRACHEDSGELFQQLEQEEDSRLRSDKLFLYYTQFGKCMYSGEPIDLESLLRGELFDIDHIFPQSKVKDNSLDNRVVVINTLNREKSNIYPIQGEIRRKMQPFWAMLKSKGMISEKKYDRLVRNTELTEEELSSFVARQLVETRQSTKALATILQETYGDQVRLVYSKAGNVSDFRQQFELVKCRDVNDLHHAKDAYLNIVVGNVYDTKFTEVFFRNIKKEKYSLKKVFEFDTPGAWDKTESIKTVKKYMAKNNVLVTWMPQEKHGKIFDLMLVRAGKAKVNKKQGLDQEKYGGYTMRYCAYFCLVEHRIGKKRVRSIKPVYMYQKVAYEQDPLEYCRNILMLHEPRVIVQKILVGALMELNGKRLTLTAGEEGRIKLNHTYQLIVGEKYNQYIKNASKYYDRCTAQKAELPVTQFDGISDKDNIDLYHELIRKCKTSIYYSCFGAFNIIAEEMEKCEDIFTGMSTLDQIKILLEVIKAFRCNAVYANFKQLSGQQVRGRIRINDKISELNTAYLINQSVTGLYEHRIDLLK
jgi:CRISPR-associated endonuclease Csn1